MTDDLDDLKALKAAMDKATPRPDAAARMENLALAQKNFDALQGSRDAARLTSATAPKGPWAGVRETMKMFSVKGGLTVTTAIVACGLVVLTPQGQSLWKTPGTVVTEGDVPPTEAQAPVVAGGENAQSSAATAQEAPPAADIPLPVTIEQMPVAAEVAQEPAPPAAPEATGQALATPEPLPPQDVEKVETDARTRTTNTPDAALDGASGSADPAPEAEMAEGFALDTTVPMPAPSVNTRMAPTADAGITGQIADTMAAPGRNTETYANAAPNPVKVTIEEPVSTFSIDVDTASYAVIRNALTMGQLPPSDAVRIEEMVNYFPYAYPAPEGDGAPFRPTISVAQTPWNPDTQLVTIGIQGALPEVENRPPLNLVFLIDTSGSMDEPNKLPLLKQSFRLMLGELRPEDQVAIVEYAGSAGVALPPTAASDRRAIEKALANLGAGGSTNGVGGLQEAYEVAGAMSEPGEVSRVILATDGDFNVGIDSPEALKSYIEGKRETGTYLSVLGFGRGNLDDATMQALAQNGNGTAAYIDTLSEAQKVLVDQLTGALFPIADDVKIQVEWNPAAIGEYRLIGYETRALRREDFNNDAVDAGELGAGLQVTAIYEVTPIGSPALLNDPLRYQMPTPVTGEVAEIGFLKMRWKEPGAQTSQLLDTPIQRDAGSTAEADFAAAIAGFGQLLRASDYLGGWSWTEAINLANAAKGDDPFGYRADAIRLMRLAQSLQPN